MLVINGHGAKKTEKIQIDQRYSIMTPGNAEDSYVLSFDNQNRHLEEMTYQNKIWPISYNNQLIEWEHYSDTSLHDINISPLQGGFNFQKFAKDLLVKKVPWGKLTQPEHDVLARGALAVRLPDSTVVILENQKLIDYLEKSEQGIVNGKPLFFCDKELGKVKPMGNTTLSEIYTAVGMIDEFKHDGAAIIVATCSPNKNNSKSITVQTQLNSFELSTVVKAPQKIEKPVESEVIPPQPPEHTLTSEQMSANAEELLNQLKLTGIKIIPRVTNYILGNDAHNKLQSVESIQFEFQTQEQQLKFRNALANMRGFKEGVIFDGLGATTGAPIMQLSPDFILSSLMTFGKASVPKSLTDLLKEVEQTTGSFSAYKTTIGDGEDISFTNKPAQKFLTGLGVVNKKNAPLSTKPKGEPIPEAGNDSVSVTGFDPSHPTDNLVITGTRIDRLIKSAKTYVNTDIFPEGQFATAIKQGGIHPQDKGISPTSKLHWQNMAAGVCHVQEIDLLVEQIVDSDGEAVCAPRKGVIDENAPALLLLSSPALNFSYGTGNSLNETQKAAFIAGMFRNLFNATVSEGRQYIAMPAAGLGVFGGDPELYFSKLMEVAKEFPELNIIYHPAANGAVFDKQLKLANPANVVRAHKDVMFIANELTQQGYPCAFHNPSDADVVYGLYDVGEYWKFGTGSGYVGEEHIGAMTTAPLNSRLLNPSAYQNVVEHAFTKTKTHEIPVAPEIPVANDNFKNATPPVNTEFEKQNLALITDKLAPLTKKYLMHLNNSYVNCSGRAKELADTKITIVIKLLDNLREDTQQNLKPSERVKNFFKELDRAESKLQEHRDPAWKRYATNALICAGILISGILPGLVALAVYANTGEKEGKSMSFWTSHGKNVVNELRQCKSENMKDEEAGKENMSPK